LESLPQAALPDEYWQAMPSLDALKKIATTLHVSTDYLLFDEHERGPDDTLTLQFEAVSCPRTNRR